MPPPHLVLQTGDGKRNVACDGFYDLPTTQPAYVAIVTDGTTLAEAEAQRLRFELRRQILALGNARLEINTLPCGPCPAFRRDFDCTAIDRSASSNVIVFIGDGRNPPQTDPPMTMSPSSVTTVLVLTPRGAPIPSAPWVSPTTNTGQWTSSADEFIPQIFAAAGLTEPESRIFISYRRDEASDLAEQLFEALAKRNFDVFVDRFRIEVGADFQQRILQELARKSMAVFLETAGILRSKWTRYEVAVAKSARLGVFSLRVPGGTRIRQIDASRRLDITPVNGVLDPIALDTVVARIQAEHSRSVIRRRRLQRESMQRALQRAGVYSQTLTNGIIEVIPALRSSKRYLVWLPSRPAELRDFHYVATAPATNVARTIIAPAAHLTGDDRSRMRWLADVAQVRSFDEGLMYQVAVAMQRELL